MQLRFLASATLLHGAIILGVGLGVHSWLTEDPIRAEVAIVPWVPESQVMDELEIIEASLPPDEVLEEEFAEPEFTPPPAPRPDEAAEDEAEDVREPIDTVYSTPSPIRATPELRMRIKPEARPEPQVAAPAPAASFVEAIANDTNEPPRYPALARRRGVEGDVVLLVTVDARGEVIKVALQKSAGLTAAHKALHHAAITAVFRWRYRPAMRDGKATETVIKVPIEFRLR